MKTASNHNFKTLEGQTFAYLTVLNRVENTPSGKSRWNCRCVCGKETQVRSDHLRASKIKSCGCKLADLVSEAVRVPMNTLGIYNGMKERVLYECTPSYSHYKKVGVRICAGWLASYKNFFADMGERPPGKTLDRIDGSANYSCGHCSQCLLNGWVANCKWSTAREQARNRSSNVMIEYKGEKRCAMEWAEILGMSVNTIYQRIRNGWHPTEAVAMPVRALNRGVHATDAPSNSHPHQSLEPAS